jgi:hypothetical protein
MNNGIGHFPLTIDACHLCLILTVQVPDGTLCRGLLTNQVMLYALLWTDDTAKANVRARGRGGIVQTERERTSVRTRAPTTTAKRRPAVCACIVSAHTVICVKARVIW